MAGIVVASIFSYANSFLESYSYLIILSIWLGWTSQLLFNKTK